MPPDHVVELHASVCLRAHMMRPTARTLGCCNGIVQATATALQPPSPIPRRLVWAREAGRVAALRGGAALSAAPVRAIGGRLVSGLRMSGGLLTSGAIIGGANLLGLGITLFSGACQELRSCNTLSYPGAHSMLRLDQRSDDAAALECKAKNRVTPVESHQPSQLPSWARGILCFSPQNTECELTQT
jgi:hypothetical protein